jgi:RNA polymerase sigma-70 factor (ECF subfamily)
LDEVVRQYGNAIFRYCYGILCDYHEAQDAMQETFAKAYMASGSLKSRDSIGAWIYRIAYNNCINLLRKRKRRQIISEIKSEEYYSDEPFIDPVLTEALMILSPRERALFYSRAVEDLDYNRLESIYNEKAATLRKQYERARKKLKEHLSGYLKECMQ